jgi:hypothetical protein
MAWTKISKERERAISDIAKHIRFSIMDQQFFNDVVLANNPFVEKAKKEIIRRRDNRVKKHRIPNELVISMGGFTSEPCTVVELFNLRSNTWTVLSLDFVPHAYHGMIALDNKIFVLGGFGDAGNGPGYFQETFCSKIYLYFYACRVLLGNLSGVLINSDFILEYPRSASLHCQKYDYSPPDDLIMH